MRSAEKSGDKLILCTFPLFNPLQIVVAESFKQADDEPLMSVKNTESKVVSPESSMFIQIRGLKRTCFKRRRGESLKA